MSVFISGGATITFDKEEQYRLFWEGCMKPPEIVLQVPGGIMPETRGFLWQGFFIRYSKAL